MSTQSRFIYTCFLVFSLPLCIHAQSNFEVFGGYRFEGETTQEGEEFTRSSTSLFFLDSLQIQSQIELTGIPSLTVRPKGAFTIGVRQNIMISEQLNFSIGLQYIYQSFEYESTTTNIATKVIRVDTLPSSFDPPIFSNNCDQFISEGPDFTEFQPADRIGYLRFPIDISLKPAGLDDIQIGIGLYIQTPIHISSRQISSQFEQEEINGENICTITRSIFTNHDPGDYAPLNFGVSGGFRYFLSEQFHLFVTAEKTFSNLFYNGSEESINTLNNSERGPYRPMVFTTGIAKRFKSGT